MRPRPPPARRSTTPRRSAGPLGNLVSATGAAGGTPGVRRWSRRMYPDPGIGLDRRQPTHGVGRLTVEGERALGWGTGVPCPYDRTGGSSASGSGRRRGELRASCAAHASRSSARPSCWPSWCWPRSGCWSDGRSPVVGQMTPPAWGPPGASTREACAPSPLTRCSEPSSASASDWAQRSPVLCWPCTASWRVRRSPPSPARRRPAPGRGRPRRPGRRRVSPRRRGGPPAGRRPTARQSADRHERGEAESERAV